VSQPSRILSGAVRSDGPLVLACAERVRSREELERERAIEQAGHGRGYREGLAEGRRHGAAEGRCAAEAELASARE